MTKWGESETADNLLVDFPSTPRTPKESVSIDISNSGLSSETTRRPRGVHFSTHNEMEYIDVTSSEEKSARWYSSKDKRRFKKTLINEVRKMTEVLATPSHKISASDLSACVGLEVFLSQGLAKRIRDKRDMHTNAILEEQCRQIEVNIWDDDRLSRISEKSSRWSRGRSHDIALGYWEIDNE